LLESHVNEVKGKADEDARKSRDMMMTIQGKLDAANTDSQDARQALTSLRGRAENQENDFTARLDQCRSVLSRVAEEYGRLATTTVVASNHATLMKDHTALQLRSFRLERKLANSEGQVVELANLVRHTQEENTLLCQELRDAREEAAFHLQTLQENRAVLDSCSHRTELHELLCLEGDIHQNDKDIAREAMAVQESTLACSRTISDFYRSHNDELLSECSHLHGILEKQHEIDRALIDRLGRDSAERDALQAELTKAQVEIITGQRALADAQISLTEGRAEQLMLQRRVEEFENNIRDTAAGHKQALQRERDTSQKLSVALHVSKTAEDVLKADIEQLQADLAGLSRFQEAYYNLVDETEALVARNNLAEEEAENLSKFNAEILGHNNPVQRILYVDRIRRELSEVKQKLLACTRDRDAISAANEDLLHEIMMYKSVAVPEDNKPRTNLTRVTRPPLTSQSINIVAVSPVPPCASPDALVKATVLEHIPGDMTLDELI
jgi:DNA repair exonuclease SbcCD ATPase subunit